MKRVFPIALAAIAVLASTAAAAPQITLTIFGAGTLAAPFRQIDEELSRMYPNLTIQAQFGGSVKMVKQVTELHQVADVVAVADYNVIPKYLFGTGGSPAYTTWYAGFATNAITFVYTGRSRFAGEITSQNWYQVLARPGVQIGRSNPDTDPSGYQTVQMLALAEKHYKRRASRLQSFQTPPGRTCATPRQSSLPRCSPGRSITWPSTCPTPASTVSAM